MTEELLDGARENLRAGRYEDASQQLEKALAARADDPAALRMLGTLRYLTNDLDNAAELLQRSLSLDPDNVKTLLNIGTVYLKLGRLDDAVATYEQITGLDPGDADAQFNLGVAQQQRGNMQAASQALGEALRLDPAHTDAEINLAVVSLSLGDVATCLRHSERVLTKQPANRPARLTRAWALIRSGNLDDGGKLIAALQQEAPDDTAVAVEWSKYLTLLGHYTEAKQVLATVLERQPEHQGATRALVRALHETREFEAAADACTVIVHDSPDSASMWRALAVNLERLDRLGEADKAYEQAIELDSKPLLGLLAYATARLGRGELDAAEELLSQARQQAPDNIAARVLQIRLDLKREAFDQASNLVDESLQLNPRDRSLLALKSTILPLVGRVNECRQLLDFERLVHQVQVCDAGTEESIQTGTGRTVVTFPQGFGASIDDFNRALATHVREHPSLTREPLSHATRDGYHSGPLRVSPKGPIAALEQLMVKMGRQYMKRVGVDPQHPFLREPQALGMLNCWGVVMRGQGHQTSHIHPAAWLSGVYYPQVPDSFDADDSQAGCIEFGIAPDQFGLPPSAITHTVKPCAGLMVIFPSYFYHRTIPFESEQERISIAFDLLPSLASGQVGTEPTDWLVSSSAGFS